MLTAYCILGSVIVVGVTLNRLFFHFVSKWLKDEAKPDDQNEIVRWHDGKFP